MAEDRAEPREITWRTLLPWTELFRGFQIALDLNKLLLAAGGLLTTAFGLWLLAAVFGTAFDGKPPTPDKYETWAKFKAERDNWNLMNRTAGLSSSDLYVEAGDVAENKIELDAIERARRQEEQDQRADLGRSGQGREGTD